MKELAANLRPTIPPAFKWYVTLLPIHGIFAEGSAHLTETRPKKRTRLDSLSVRCLSSYLIFSPIFW